MSAGPLWMDSTVDRINERLLEAERLLANVPEEHLITVARSMVRISGLDPQDVEDINTRRKAIAEIWSWCDPVGFTPDWDPDAPAKVRS